MKPGLLSAPWPCFLDEETSPIVGSLQSRCSIKTSAKRRRMKLEGSRGVEYEEKRVIKKTPTKQRSSAELRGSSLLEFWSSALTGLHWVRCHLSPGWGNGTAEVGGEGCRALSAGPPPPPLLFMEVRTGGQTSHALLAGNEMTDPQIPSQRLLS